MTPGVLLALVSMSLALAALAWARRQNRQLYELRCAAIDVVMAERLGNDRNKAIAELAELVDMRRYAPPGYLPGDDEWPNHIDRAPIAERRPPEP